MSAEWPTGGACPGQALPSRAWLQALCLADSLCEPLYEVKVIADSTAAPQAAINEYLLTHSRIGKRMLPASDTAGSCTGV